MAKIETPRWDQDPHTKAKHDLLNGYFNAWLPIMGRRNRKLNFIDAFAGPGRYTHGEPGSPVVILNAALDHRYPPGCQVNFWFIEKDARRARLLEEELEARFAELPEGWRYHVENNAFHEAIESMLDKLEEDGGRLAPALLFIDPFGFKGVPLSLIQRFMQHRSCEVLITFMVGHLSRLAEQFEPKLLDELFGCKDWRETEGLGEEDRCQALGALYMRQLQESGCARHVWKFMMRNEKNRLVYHLVFGTNHWRGLEVMKEAMCALDPRRTYTFSDKMAGQTFLPGLGEDDASGPSVGQAVYEHFRGQTVSEKTVHMFVVTDTDAPYRKREILKPLEESGHITHVEGRQRRGSYPEGCKITFRE